MDPEATWMQVLDHLQTNDTNEALDSMMDLYDWYAKGGFTPENKAVPNQSMLGALMAAMGRHRQAVGRVSRKKTLL